MLVFVGMASNEAKEVVFSAEEVQRHVSPGDCWIIVRGKVGLLAAG